MGLLVDAARLRAKARPVAPPRRPQRPRESVVVVLDPPATIAPPASPPPTPTSPTVVEELAPPSPPAPIEPPEGLDEEGLYVFHERVGIGLELGMTEEAAAEIAGVEAWLAHTTNTRLRELGAKAIEGFGGAWAVEVRNITKEPTS